MSVVRFRGAGPAILAALVGLVVGGAAGWGRGTPRNDLGALEQEMAAAMRTVDPVLRRGAVIDALAQMRPETISALRAGLEREFRFADRCVVPAFAAAWAAFDPITAYEVAVGEWKDAVKRSRVTSEVAYVLARTGRVERARVLASRLTLSRVRWPTWAGLADGMIRSGDLEGATAFLLQHPDTADRNRIIERFLQYFMLHGDHEGLMAWVEGIPDRAPNRIKTASFNLASRWLASADPQRAAAWIESQPEGAPYARNAHLRVAEEWIEHDPEAALTWILEREQSHRRTFVIRSVLRRFVERSPREAAAWMERQDPLGDAEIGIGELVPVLRREEPAEALAWALRLSDEKRRDRMVESVATEWMERDPEAARAWLADSALPDALRERIESRASKPAESEAP